MAFPASTSPAILSDQESVQAILEAEAGIIDCMAQYFGSPNGAVAIIAGAADLATSLELFNTILPAYTNKENSIGRVISGGAKKLAADKNIDPCAISGNC